MAAVGVGGLVVVAMWLGACAQPATAATSAPTAASGAGLRVALAGTAQAPALELTNGSSSPCVVATSDVGTTHIESIKQDGRAITPNRQLNHAIHIAAVTQIRNRHTTGRVFYDRKIAEGKSPKMALRALKRRVSDALNNAMIADARRAAKRDPGGQRGTTLTPARPAHTPDQLFG